MSNHVPACETVVYVRVCVCVSESGYERMCVRVCI